MHPIKDRITAIRQGNRLTVARTMTHIENQMEGYEATVDTLYPHVGTAWRIGITGPPGAGKSTLVNRLIGHFRATEHKVGVIAVDPSSPFTGGALLGDRIRMEERTSDRSVFIRSVATRGALGGLSIQTEAIADVLDVGQYDPLLIETVGVGQAELDVAQATDTVVVVLVPESGDAIQAMKAGLMEIADIFCINKSDHPDADALAHHLESMLRLRPPKPAQWRPCVVQTIATQAERFAPLVEALGRHRDFLQETSGWQNKRDERLRRRVRQLVTATWQQQFWTEGRQETLESAIELDAYARKPHMLAQQLIEIEHIDRSF